jgi:hypothetical protein
MRSKGFIVTLTVMLWASTTLSAGVVPGRWEKVAAENLGSSFIITMQSGERIDGYFKGMSEDYLDLTLLDGKERSVRKADVAKIITAKRRMDSLSNGFLIGAAVGAGLPAIAIAAEDCCYHAGAAAAVIVIWGLIGGAIGVGIDAVIQGHITLYQSPGDKSKP